MYPLAVNNKLAILGGTVLLVLTTSCGESTSYTSSSSNQPTSNYTPKTTQQVEPSISEISNNPLGECPYDITSLKEILIRKSNAVSDRFTGNVPLNADLSVAIAIAQKVVEDPRCQQAAEIAQLPQLISVSQQALSIGQARVKTTMQQASYLQESANRFLTGN